MDLDTGMTDAQVVKSDPSPAIHPTVNPDPDFAMRVGEDFTVRPRTSLIDYRALLKVISRPQRSFKPSTPAMRLPCIKLITSLNLFDHIADVVSR